MSSIFAIIGAALVGSWGGMHLIMTGPATAGFEPLSDDNRHVPRMEWIAEGVALCFVAALVVVATLGLGRTSPGAVLVNRASAAFLAVMAVVSVFTGARASPLPYKLCAPIFLSAGLLLVAATMVG